MQIAKWWFLSLLVHVLLPDTCTELHVLLGTSVFFFFFFFFLNNMSVFDATVLPAHSGVSNFWRLGAVLQP